MEDTYLTIATTAEGNYKEKGSKFLGFAFPVHSEELIARHIQALAEKYHDARHHCYAWRLGPDGKHYRAHDAGEPNHSAGTPILNAIRSRELLDVLVVVVRYFGGTKLGIPGLIHAYGAAAAGALDAAHKVEYILTKPLSIVFPYAQTSEVGRVIQKYSLKPLHSEYGVDCRQSFDVRLRDWEPVATIFKEMGILSQE